MGMKRTRKWQYVRQEAERLAGLGLSAREIARRLEIHESSISRWIKAGKLTISQGSRPAGLTSSRGGQTAAEWAAAVREAFDLDATDEQVVDLAESALLVARDPNTPGSLRLQAMGRFQALVKQLALVARVADAKPERDEAPKRKTFEAPRRTGTDPRGILSGVN